jgi:hypothetical protein
MADFLNWLYGAAVAFMPFVVLWLLFRVDKLSKKIDWCMDKIEFLVAHHADPDQAAGILGRWKWEKEERLKKIDRQEKRKALIPYAITGVVVVGVAIWFFLYR